ncbi:predicted protein [Chaetoceros tenuissimus]|uniref:Uncharacterized protein n=1 Tax=Chaetoceros tenuissimus TaxID=426638 RepID=A0AAD3H5E0_9STRA|nr:predicted protein [Chaetoceros tenuissimus]
MALSIARNASPESTGKEILQRFRDLVKQKSAQKGMKTPNSASVKSEMSQQQELHQNAALDLTMELKEAAKQIDQGGDIPIFHEIAHEELNSVEKLKPVIDVGSEMSVGSMSVKTRMKQSLAKRRTALQSRNVNVIANEDENASKESKLMKKNYVTPEVMLNKSESITTQQQKEEPKEVPVEEEANNKDDNSNASARDDISHGTGLSLELDASVESSDIQDSMDKSSQSISAASPMPQDMSITNKEDSQIGNVTILETLVEEPESDEQSKSEEDANHSSDIEKENGELISLANSCESVNSNSSSALQSPKMFEHESPRSQAISETSPLTPADSIQTFSVFTNSSQKSRLSSNTPTDSIQTFSVGGRSMSIANDAFKMSIFSPHLRISDDFSNGAHSENQKEQDESRGGETLIPDVSVRDQSQAFSTPGQRMWYSSPASRLSLSLNGISPSGSAVSELDELSRELDAVRSAQKESGMEINKSSDRAKELIHIYDQINEDVERQDSLETSMMGNLSVVSPVSKALATDDPSGITSEAAARLIERNKTLVKEVRFADQACVELSERNLALNRELQKMDSSMEELKTKNDSLHETIVTNSQYAARLEEEKRQMQAQIDKLTTSLEGEKERSSKLEEEAQSLRLKSSSVEERVTSLTAKLEEETKKNEELSFELDQKANSSQQNDQRLTIVTAKYESIMEEYTEAKATISTLKDRLASVESTSELAASTAAQKFREASFEMQKENEDLRDKLEEYEAALEVERAARYEAEDECLNWRDLCEELEAKQSYVEKLNVAQTNTEVEAKGSPCRSEVSKRTTSSVVIAKTLKEEIEKGREATERIIEAEKIIAVTQSKLRDAERELQAARDENKVLTNKLQVPSFNSVPHPTRPQDDSSLESMESSSVSESESEAEERRESNLMLANAKSQCEEYKREIDSILSQIKAARDMNEPEKALSVAGHDNSSIVATVKDLASTCSKINIAAGNRVGELESKIKFIADSMDQLQEICNEDQSDVSGNSYTLQMMEEGTTTPVKKNRTPMKVLFMQDSQSNVSPTASDASLEPARDKTPVKMIRLRHQLQDVEEQLQTAVEEKESLEEALEEAKSHIELMTAGIENANKIARASQQVIEENKLLEKSVTLLKSHIEQLEESVTILEEEREVFLNGDSIQEQELEEALSTIDSLKEDKFSLEGVVQQLTNDKNLLSKELAKVTSSFKNQADVFESEKKELESEICYLKEAMVEIEASRDRFHSEANILTSENDDQVEMIHELQESMAEVQGQFQEMKSSFLKCNEELAEMVETKLALEKENDELYNTVNKYHKQLSERSSILETMTAEGDEIKDKLAAMEKAYDSLHKEHVEMGSQVEILVSMNDEYQADLDSARDQIHGLESEVEEFKSSLESNVSELSNATYELKAKNVELLQVQTSLQKKENTVKALENEFQTLKNEMNATTAIHESAISSMREELEKTMTKLEVAERKVDEYQLESRTAFDEMCSKDEEITKLRNKSESLMRKNSRMREYVKNLTSKCKEWEATFAEKENLNLTFQRKYEESMRKISDLTNQVNNTSISISSKASTQSEQTDAIKENKINNLKRRLLERAALDKQ